METGGGNSCEARPVTEEENKAKIKEPYHCQPHPRIQGKRIEQQQTRNSTKLKSVAEVCLNLVNISKKSPKKF